MVPFPNCNDRKHIDVSNRSLLIVVVVGVLQWMFVVVDARTWDAIVNTSWYSTDMIDPYRDSGKSYNPNSIIKTLVPTDTPTSVPILNIATTPTPTAMPSTTAVPTASFCSEQHQQQHVEAIITMRDSWGDGWGDTKLIISQPQSDMDNRWNHTNDTMFESYSERFTAPQQQLQQDGVVDDDIVVLYEETLLDGYTDSIPICLQVNICYTVIVNGTQSEWQKEIQWDIRQKTNDNNETSAVTTLAKGYAPSKCQFSLPDANNNGTYICSFSCINTNNHTDVDDDDVGSIAPSTTSSSSSSRSTSPTHVPSDLPTMIPSVSDSTTTVTSDFPSSLSSSIVPSYVPSSIPTGGNIAIIDTPTTTPSTVTTTNSSTTPSLSSVSPKSPLPPTNGTSPKPPPSMSPATTKIDENRSLHPSAVNSIMDSTTLQPTVTYQPTTTVYPTSYMSGGSISIGGGSGGGSNSSAFVDDDSFISNNPAATLPVPSSPSTTIAQGPVDVPGGPTKALASSGRGYGSSTLYPTVTGHPSSYGAEFMNEIVVVHETSIPDASSFVEQQATFKNEPVSSPASVGDEFPLLSASASLDDDNDEIIQSLPGTASATVDDDIAIPTGTSSASIDDDTISDFTGSSSAVVDDDTTPPFGASSSASVDDDTLSSFGSVKLEDDDLLNVAVFIKPPALSPTRTTGDGDVSDWLEAVILRPTHRSPRSSPVGGKELFESVFSPGKPTTNKEANPIRKIFYDFIYSLRPPTQNIPNPTRPMSIPSNPVRAPIFSPTRPIFAPNKPASTPSKPVVSPTRPISSPTKPVFPPTKPVTTPTKPIVTPVSPPRPVAAPRRVPTPRASTPRRAPTFNPTTTMYPTITAQPTTTMYPTITSFPTADVP